ncbi:MAG: LysR family transcriptional regulator [Actinomycetota bacterium]
MQVVHESLDRSHLEVLIALRHTGHLGQAADQLALSPSAASHRLKEIERRLGVAITEAEGRGIRLTPGGLHLADVATQADATLRSAEATARWMASADRPTVRLALDFYDTAPWFEPLLGVDRDADVDLVRVGYADTDGAVNRRRADLGVIVGPRGAVDEEPLARDELVAVVPADHAAADRGVLIPSDISDATYVTAGDRPQTGFEHHEFFEPAGVRPRHMRKVESLSMILRLIRRFGGISVQPRLALPPDLLDDLCLVPLADRTIEVEWHAVHRPDPPAAIIDLVDRIRDLL